MRSPQKKTNANSNKKISAYLRSLQYWEPWSYPKLWKERRGDGVLPAQAATIPEVAETEREAKAERTATKVRIPPSTCY